MWKILEDPNQASRDENYNVRSENYTEQNWWKTVRLNTAEVNAVNLKTTKETIQHETQREKRTFFNEVSCGTTSGPSFHITGISEGEGHSKLSEEISLQNCPNFMKIINPQIKEVQQT